jgi:YgiT-type zinc finger domain-containing protein
MKCYACGEGILEEILSEEDFHYKGHFIVISNYITERCPVCSEEFVEKECSKYTGKILTEWKLKIDEFLEAK